jgi:hypothetical protein
MRLDEHLIRGYWDDGHFGNPPTGVAYAALCMQCKKMMRKWGHKRGRGKKTK